MYLKASSFSLFIGFFLKIILLGVLCTTFVVFLAVVATKFLPNPYNDFTKPLKLYEAFEDFEPIDEPLQSLQLWPNLLLAAFYRIIVNFCKIYAKILKFYKNLPIYKM